MKLGLNLILTWALARRCRDTVEQVHDTTQRLVSDGSIWTIDNRTLTWISSALDFLDDTCRLLSTDVSREIYLSSDIREDIIQDVISRMESLSSPESDNRRFHLLPKASRPGS